MKLERHGSLRADLSLVGITAVWGFTFPAMQLALRDATPMAFMASRFAIAAIALALIFRGRALRPGSGAIGSGILLGLCLTAGSALQISGLLYTTAAKSAFITALYVVLVPLFSLALARTRPRITSLAAVLIAGAGLAEITAIRLHGLNPGDMLTVGCAVAFALHIVVAEIAAPRHDAIALGFWQTLTTAAASAILMVAIEHRPGLPMTPWTITALLVTSLPATALAFSVQMWAQKETSGTHTALIFCAEPVFAAAFARLIQQERLGMRGFVGGALILGAILVSELGTRRRIGLAAGGRPAGSPPETAPPLRGRKSPPSGRLHRS
ncbi:MAG: DMT family transporter [Armatimonadota bacterium]|jgi:drug/metabolite transporter (DMT)-like permease